MCADSINRDPRSAAEICPDRWLTDNELAKLASSGAIEGRRRTPPVRGLTRRLFGVMRIAFVALALWAVSHIGPRAVSWISEHLGATAAAVSL